MKKHWISALYLLFILATTSVAYQTENMVVVVLDGARYTETFGNNSSNLNHALIPHIWNDLRPLGAINTSFYNLGTTITNSSHASIESGIWQIIANDGTQRPYYPTFFEYLRQQQSINSTLTWMIAGKAKLDVCSYSTTTSGYSGAPYGAMVFAANYTDNNIWNVLQTTINTYHPKLVFVNFGDIDRAGHSGVWSDYTSAIFNADQIIYNLWNTITTDTYYRDKTGLIVTNDHGRNDDAHGGFQNHGDSCDGCRHIMLLALGPDFKPNYISTVNRSQIDICPTIGWILGFDPLQATGTRMTDILIYPIPVELFDFTALQN
jgi:hypothetical protein